MEKENLIKNILIQLINNIYILETTPSFLKIKNHLSLKELAKQFGTIKLQSHRQSGHTSAIRDLATQSSLIIVPDGQHPLYKTKDNFNTICAGTNLNILFGKPKINMLFVDQASCIQNEYLMKLYEETFLSRVFFNYKIPILIFLE